MTSPSASAASAALEVRVVECDFVILSDRARQSAEAIARLNGRDWVAVSSVMAPPRHGEQVEGTYRIEDDQGNVLGELELRFLLPSVAIGGFGAHDCDCMRGKEGRVLGLPSEVAAYRAALRAAL